MQLDQAPPVVAVVVTNEPGPWLEECLAALVAQDYPSCSVLVVDQASSTDLAGRVASVAPAAYLWRNEENRGYGPGANEVLSLVDGAAFYLFCHDDVVLRPHAVHALVEEAFRSNAGIVGPKLIDPDDPDRILQLGLGVDRLGAPVRRIERGEYDQAQHDEVAEVFAVPGGATLVRADLFAAIGGYDPEISLLGEDVDLCWRARLAGARIVVAPAAVAAHLEATASRRRPCPEARTLQWRHELRAVLKNYGRARRAIALAQLVVLSLAEVVYFVAIGKTWRARQVVDAWRWNLSPARRLGEARAALVATRRVPERDVCALFDRRSLRVVRFARPLLESRALDRRHRAKEPRLYRERAAAARQRLHRPRGVAALALAVVLVLLVGSRSLLAGNLPLVGGLLPIPGPGTLLGHFLGGVTNAGMQHPGPASPALALLGLASAALIGGNGLLMHVLLAASVALGAFGVIRLVRPVAGPPARLVAAVGYLFLPLAWNDVARGDLVGLFAFAGVPWILVLLARAAEPGEGLWWQSLRLGLLLAVVASFAPVTFLLALALAAAFGLGSVLTGRHGEAGRILAVAGGGAVAAFVLGMPWSLTFLQDGARWSALVGASTTSAAAAPALGGLLRFAVGPMGGGLLGWGLLAAAGLVLLVGRGPRLVWGVRLWVGALASFTLAWAAAEGWLGSGGGQLRLLLAPAAACVAGAIGLGAAAIQEDLRRSGLGWRQLATAACGLCATAGLLPVLGAALGGRWGLVGSGYRSVLAWTATPAITGRPGHGANAATGSGTRAVDRVGRVLWLGDPAALPLASWQIRPGLAAAVSHGGLPDATSLWATSNPGAMTAVMADVVEADAGGTIELGHLLAPYGIRYLVVPTALAPRLGLAQTAPAAPAPQPLLDALAAQSDLHALPSAGGALVFLDAAWRPTGGIPADVGRASATTPAPLRSLAVVLEVGAFLAAGTALARRGRQRAAGAHRIPARLPRPAGRAEMAAPDDATPAVPGEDDRPLLSAGAGPS